jgi:hypothetical protein
MAFKDIGMCSTLDVFLRRLMEYLDDYDAVGLSVATGAAKFMYFKGFARHQGFGPRVAQIRDAYFSENGLGMLATLVFKFTNPNCPTATLYVTNEYGLRTLTVISPTFRNLRYSDVIIDNQHYPDSTSHDESSEEFELESAAGCQMTKESYDTLGGVRNTWTCIRGSGYVVNTYRPYPNIEAAILGRMDKVVALFWTATVVGRQNVHGFRDALRLVQSPTAPFITALIQNWYVVNANEGDWFVSYVDRYDQGATIIPPETFYFQIQDFLRLIYWYITNHVERKRTHGQRIYHIEEEFDALSLLPRSGR